MVPAKANAQPERVLDAALACVARVGVAKTTLDDVAREAGCARATVYRCFPGRDALLGAVLEREVALLAARVVAAADRADTLTDAIVAVVIAAGEPFRSHAALGFVLAHEPEIVTAQLSFERGSELLETAAAFAAPAFLRFLPADRAERLAEWVARLTLSYLCNPSEQVRLDDPAYVRALVVDYVLPGFARNPNSLASTPAAGGSQL
jgi:AcrR family transcriptional regulator